MQLTSYTLVLPNQIFGAVAGESNGIFKSEKLNDISSLLQVQVEDSEIFA